MIISTRGRVAELERLFRSFKQQTHQDFEIILSDQNDDDRLVALIHSLELGERFIHIQSSGGASRGRNQGILRATGEILTFPDDDCAYPPRLLESVDAFFQEHAEFGFLSSRAFGDGGEDSVSRFSRQAAEITKLNIHSQCVEFGVFFRRSALGETKFDEEMGVGAPTPWHSDEGPDLLLRLMENGVRGYYDPEFAIWHPQPVTLYDEKAIDRTYRYACGNGYFYRKHSYPRWYFFYQMARSSLGLLLALATLRTGKRRLYLARLRGRWRGWQNNPTTKPRLERL